MPTIHSQGATIQFMNNDRKCLAQLDKDFVKIGEGNKASTVTVRQFVSSENFNKHGTPSDRLKLLVGDYQNKSIRERLQSGGCGITSGLKNYIGRLEQGPQAKTATSEKLHETVKHELPYNNRQEAKEMYIASYKEAIGVTEINYPFESDRAREASFYIGQMEQLAKPAGISPQRLEQQKREVYNKLYSSHLESVRGYYSKNSQGTDTSALPNIENLENHPDTKLAQEILQKAGISDEQFKTDVVRVKYLAKDHRWYMENRSTENQVNQS